MPTLSLSTSRNTPTTLLRHPPLPSVVLWTHSPVQKHFTNLIEGIRGVDVVYMTRIQRERFTNSEDYERAKRGFVLTPKVLKEASAEEDDDYAAFVTGTLPL